MDTYRSEYVIKQGLAFPFQIINIVVEDSLRAKSAYGGINYKLSLNPTKKIIILLARLKEFYSERKKPALAALDFSTLIVDVDLFSRIGQI